MAHMSPTVELDTAVHADTKTLFISYQSILFILEIETSNYINHIKVTNRILHTNSPLLFLIADFALKI